MFAHATPATAPGVTWVEKKEQKEDKVQTTSDLQIFGIFLSYSHLERE